MNKRNKTTTFKLLIVLLFFGSTIINYLFYGFEFTVLLLLSLIVIMLCEAKYDLLGEQNEWNTRRNTN